MHIQMCWAAEERTYLLGIVLTYCTLIEKLTEMKPRPPVGYPKSLVGRVKVASSEVRLSVNHVGIANRPTKPWSFK